MLQLAQLLNENAVHLDVPCFTREDILLWIASFFESSTTLSKEVIYQHLFQREMAHSTGLGYSVAIPHARIQGLHSVQMLFVRTQSEVDFDAPDGKGVLHFFALLVPENATDQHLELLSEIVQIFGSEHLRSYLTQATDSQQVLKVLRTEHENLSGLSRSP